MLREILDSPAFATNAAKMPWAGQFHLFGYEMSEEKIYVKTHMENYEYDLKVIATIAGGTFCFAWDNHPLGFSHNIIYNGELKNRLTSRIQDGFAGTAEELAEMILDVAEDLPGMIYIFDASTTEHAGLYMIFYIE